MERYTGSFQSKRHMVLYASLITGNVIQCKGGVITIKYDQQYAFNIKRLEKEDSRKIVDEIFSHELKENVRIKYIVDKKEEKKSPEEILKEAFGEDLVEIIDE